MVTVINESKTLTLIYHANENISLIVENLTRIKTGITINDGVSAKIKKQSWVWKRLYLASFYMYMWERSIFSKCYWEFRSYVWYNYWINNNKSNENCSNRKYGNKFQQKKADCKMKNFYILLAFLLITISLLVIVSIYFFFIKNWSKQKSWLPSHYTSFKKKLILKIYYENEE